MDVNDYLDEPPIRRTQPRGAARSQARAASPPQPQPQPRERDQNYLEYIPRPVRDARQVNDGVLRARQEFDREEFLPDDDDEQYNRRAPVEKKRSRGLFSKLPRGAVNERKPKRDLIQVVVMFLLAVGTIGLSAWQAWTASSINAGALSIRWVHVSQAMIALQILILFFVVDLKKE